jgi:site-specific DNA-methyltransferase (adenine-specific)
VFPLLVPVDLVVTDPPYGCGYKTNHRKRLQTPEMLIGDDKPLTDIVTPLVKTLKPNSAIYLCTRFDVYATWEKALMDAGAKLKTTIVWDKGNWTAGDLRGDYGCQVELLLFAHVGRPLLRKGRPSNLWLIPRDPPGEHPTPKPVALFRKCIENSSDAENTVFDPFLGSGTTAVACIQTGRKFIGCEIEPKYFDMACKRIEAAYAAGGRHEAGDRSGLLQAFTKHPTQLFSQI